MDEKSHSILAQLEEKLDQDGQNLSCHLEGMLHSQYITYWDYMQLPLLLNIQCCRTTYADEMVFIVYHQITELYFKLILHEIRQIKQHADDTALFHERLIRINRYMDNLIHSFDIVHKGLQKEEFLKFRTALTPASGFQSYQFRLIEVACTGLANLLSGKFRLENNITLSATPSYEDIYWKRGALANGSGKKDMALVTFEASYDGMIQQAITESSRSNLNCLFERLATGNDHYLAILKELRRFDTLFNVEWRLVHFRSAAKHLSQPKVEVIGTGGTNWKTYLPPNFQKIIFFPAAWQEEEQANWGKSFIEETV